MSTTNETRPERRYTGFGRRIILPEVGPDMFVLARALHHMLSTQLSRTTADREMAQKLAAVLGTAAPTKRDIMMANLEYESWNQFRGDVWAADAIHNFLVLDWRSYLRSLNR